MDLAKQSTLNYVMLNLIALTSSPHYCHIVYFK